MSSSSTNILRMPWITRGWAPKSCGKWQLPASKCCRWKMDRTTNQNKKPKTEEQQFPKHSRPLCKVAEPGVISQIKEMWDASMYSPCLVTVNIVLGAKVILGSMIFSIVSWDDDILLSCTWIDILLLPAGNVAAGTHLRMLKNIKRHCQRACFWFLTANDLSITSRASDVKKT